MIEINDRKKKQTKKQRREEIQTDRHRLVGNAVAGAR
jgi:hypothetical protein